MKLHLHLSIGSYYNNGLQYFLCAVYVFETSRAFLGFSLGGKWMIPLSKSHCKSHSYILPLPERMNHFLKERGLASSQSQHSYRPALKKNKTCEHQECWILEKTLLSFSHLTLPEYAQKVIDNLENKISKMGKCLNCAVIKGLLWCTWCDIIKPYMALKVMVWSLPQPLIKIYHIIVYSMFCCEACLFLWCR